MWNGKWRDSMMKFVVVEDEKNVQEQIRQLLRKISVQTEIDINIEYFSKYNEKLQKEIDNTLYRKIYIMDIELDGGLSGMEIAEKIRENDWDSEIIFVTTHDQYFDKVHRQILEVFDFIEKFQDMENRLERDIRLILDKKADKKMLKISGNHVDVDIYMRNILYILRDKEERKSIIYTDTDDITFKVSNSLVDLLEKLDSRFVQTHKSCIANKTRMVERNYAKGYFISDTGKQVDYLSRKYRKEIDKE